MSTFEDRSVNTEKSLTCKDCSHISAVDIFHPEKEICATSFLNLKLGKMRKHFFKAGG